MRVTLFLLQLSWISGQFIKIHLILILNVILLVHWCCPRCQCLVFHGVMPRLFLKEAEMFCRRTAAIYIKTICYHGDIHPSSFEIFLEQNVFVHIHTEFRTEHNRTLYCSTVWSLLIFFCRAYVSVTCEHKRLLHCHITGFIWGYVEQNCPVRVNMKGLKDPHDVVKPSQILNKV